VPALVPTPQALIDRLRRLLPHPAPPQESASADERILDAALAAFTEHGIRTTTMSRIAADAGISREWLYKHYRNRDAVVVAVGRREVLRFIDGIAERVSVLDDLTEAVIESFVFSVEFLRDNALLQRVLHSEPDILNPQLLQRSASIVDVAIQAAATYLTTLADLKPDVATTVAETLVRLVAAITVVPLGRHDDDELRAYAAAVVPAVLRIQLNE
jgi:AcrR family transcriptional regulator